MENVSARMNANVTRYGQGHFVSSQPVPKKLASTECARTSNALARDRGVGKDAMFLSVQNVPSMECVLLQKPANALQTGVDL